MPVRNEEANMRLLIPLAAAAAAGVYYQAGAESRAAVVLLGAIAFYVVVNFALMRD